MKDTGKLVTVKEAATLLGVTPQTIYVWHRRGWIKAVNLTQNRSKRRALWRIPLSEIEDRIGLPICPKTLKPITSPAICLYCKRDCIRAGEPESKECAKEGNSDGLRKDNYKNT